MLYITPSNGKIPPNALKTLKSDLQNIGAELYDLNENIDDIGLNNDTDWYDPLHFNVYGADKFSRFLAHFIAERYPIELISSNEEIWQNRIEYIRTALQTSDV